MSDFNPDKNYLYSGGIFGLPNVYDDAKLIIISVPWEVTCSYKDGTANAPDAIYKESHQIDLLDNNLGSEWEKGIFFMQAPEYLYDANSVQRRHALQIINHYEHGDKNLTDRHHKILNEINNSCKEMNTYVSEKSKSIHKDEKISALLGGDHSTAYQHIKEVASREKNMAIIQIDAHADLRKSYMGFEHSHASVMRQVAEQVSGLSKIVQLGIRDYCKEEADFMSSSPLFSTHFMSDIRQYLFKGNSLNTYYYNVIDSLPEKVYISLDIDGLNPSLCPNTGTPVPGGFEFYEIIQLFKMILASGKKIVGFDLCEVGSANETNWDANVGSRLLYQLCIHTLKSMT